MKLRATLSIVVSLLLASCANSNQLSKAIQTLSVQPATGKPTTVIAPQKAVDFSATAARLTSVVETEVHTQTVKSLEDFGRFGSPKEHGADATVVFDFIRHGVTLVSNEQYAPIVEAVVSVVGTDGKSLARRSQSATSGELHTLEEYVQNPELYREGISIAAKKLGMEIAGGL